MDKLLAIINMKRFYIIYITLLSVGSAFGQDTFTLKKAVDIALEQNLQIKNQTLNEQYNKLAIKSAYNKLLPTANGYLTGSSSWGRGIDPFTNTYINQNFNTYNGGVNANWNLFNGFYDVNNIKLQKQDIEANKTILQKIKNDITIDVILKYTNILYLQENQRVIQEQIQISKKNLELTMNKIEEGVVAKNERFKIQAQLDNEQWNLISISNQLSQNILDLKQLLNISLEKEIVLQAFDLTDIDIQKTMHHQAKEAWESSPSLMAKKINIEKSRITFDMSKSSLYPSLNFGLNIGSTYSSFNRFLNFGEQVENNLNKSISLNANIPIFNQFQTRNKIKEASFNIQRAEIEYEIEKQKTHKSILQAMQNLQASEKKLHASKSSFSSSKMSFENDAIKYSVGKIGTNELNMSKSNFFNASAALIKDKYEMIWNYYVYKIYVNETVSF
jgi:outer membrane protein